MQQPRPPVPVVPARRAARRTTRCCAPGPTRRGSRSSACCSAGFAFVVGAALVFFAVIAVGGTRSSPAATSTTCSAASTLEKVGPAELLGLNLGLASLTLVDLVHHAGAARHASALAGLGRAGDALEVLRACLGLAVVAVVAQVVVGALLPVERRGDQRGGSPTLTAAPR